MYRVKYKKKPRKETMKTVFGIKLPPIEAMGSNEIKTNINIDPLFYSLVEGRPVRPNTCINMYKQNIKNVALKKTLHGFIVDEVMRVEREIGMERIVYETATKHFEEYQNSFDKFLADDNNKTITVMKKSDGLSRELVNQTEEYKKMNYEMASLKSKLQYTDESLLILLSFQNFLNKASPILWQENHNVVIDTKHSEIFFLDTDIFQKINVNAVKKILTKLPPPQLYFENPEQLLSVFYMLEKQNLNYLLVTEELNSQKNKFLKALDLLKHLLRQELDYIEQKINEMENLIRKNELREIEVKEAFYKILEERLRHLITSETVLQLYNYVEFAYERLIAPNDTKLTSLDMTLALEREYDNLMLDISTFDLDVIKRIEKETYENGVEELKQAKHAAKLLKDVDKLSKRLKSSYEPSRNNNSN
ncbi:cilia- and flagella-associated protein 100-like [Bombyx mori]|uniref:cilia- and flagella-associated protein 100-like n=1 Tax=Bombyx mori TaxID=7091 RepID=UPI002ED43CC7